MTNEKIQQLEKQLAEAENEHLATALHFGIRKEKKLLKFQMYYLPQLEAIGRVSFQEDNIKYTMEYSGTHIDFFPKSDRLLIRRGNKWIDGSGLNFLIKTFKLNHAKKTIKTHSASKEN